jgi:hypothetical protein
MYHNPRCYMAFLTFSRHLVVVLHGGGGGRPYKSSTNIVSSIISSELFTLLYRKRITSGYSFIVHVLSRDSQEVGIILVSNKPPASRRGLPAIEKRFRYMTYFFSTLSMNHCPSIFLREILSGRLWHDFASGLV